MSPVENKKQRKKKKRIVRPTSDVYQRELVPDLLSDNEKEDETWSPACPKGKRKSEESLGTTRYPKREIKRRKLEMADDDEFVFCLFCENDHRGFHCDKYDVHMKMVKDTEVEIDHPQRAKKTLPDGLSIRVSSIPNAGEGVFVEAEFGKGTVFGPYEGIRHTNVGDSYTGYSWKITRKGQTVEYVDAENEQLLSNWLRFVNCSLSANEENVTMVQYQQNIYYQAIRKLVPGEEILVWYGEEYAKKLGLIVNGDDASETPDPPQPESKKKEEKRTNDVSEPSSSNVETAPSISVSDCIKFSYQCMNCYPVYHNDYESYWEHVNLHRGWSPKKHADSSLGSIARFDISILQSRKFNCKKCYAVYHNAEEDYQRHLQQPHCPECGRQKHQEEEICRICDLKRYRRYKLIQDVLNEAEAQIKLLHFPDFCENYSVVVEIRGRSEISSANTRWMDSCQYSMFKLKCNIFKYYNMEF